jgi:hypothetical protein
VGVTVGVVVIVGVGVGVCDAQGLRVGVGVGVVVGVGVGVFVGVTVGVGVGVGLGTCSILLQFGSNVKIVYVPYTSLLGDNKDGSKKNGNSTIPKFIVILSLSGVYKTLANSPS